MAITIHKGRKPRARRVLVYGENGVGKSSFAAQWPEPIFLNLEDGVGDLDVASTDLIRSLDQFKEAMVAASSDDFGTVVVDTVDWLEKLVFQDVARAAGKKTVEDIGFGRGYQAVERAWQDLFVGFDWLIGKGKHVLFTCHEVKLKFENPEGDSYNYWKPSLNEKGSGVLSEWCDEVFFLRFRTSTVQKTEAFNNKRALGVGGKERYICTTKSAAYEAKNRLGLPDEIQPSFDAIKPFLPPLGKPAEKQGGNIDGLITNGSSKPTGPAAEEIDFRLNGEQ